MTRSEVWATIAVLVLIDIVCVLVTVAVLV